MFIIVEGAAWTRDGAKEQGFSGRKVMVAANKD